MRSCVARRSCLWGFLRSRGPRRRTLCIMSSSEAPCFPLRTASSDFRRAHPESRASLGLPQARRNPATSPMPPPSRLAEQHVALLGDQHTVDQTVLMRLVGGQVEVALEVLDQQISRAPGELRQAVDHPLLVAQHLRHFQPHLRSLHDPHLWPAFVVVNGVHPRVLHPKSRVGQCEPLALGSGRHQKGRHLRAHAHIDCLKLVWHHPHRVVQSEARLGLAAGSVEIHRYGRAGVLRLHVEEGGDHLVRKVIIDVIGQEHDPLAIHARVDGDPCGLVHARKLVRHLGCRLGHHQRPHAAGSRHMACRCGLARG
mmetsp:Transcript_37363/g.120102  ORF Transcript_37363/g.120102 Transcript_37363/m.120102 type:complete len:312 (+) Transcript_37363:71-1006(+)